MALLLILMAGSSAFGFNYFNKLLKKSLENQSKNFGSVIFLLQSLDNEERAAALLIKTGEASRKEALSNSAEEFIASLAKMQKDAEEHSDEERELRQIIALTENYKLYDSARSDFFASQEETTIDEYAKKVRPLAEAVKRDIIKLLELNHKRSLKIESDVHDAIIFQGIQLGVLVLLAIFSMWILSRSLNKHFLTPLGEIKAFRETISSGELNRRLHIEGGDELSHLAKDINTLLDTELQLESRMRGRLNHQRQLLLGMIHRAVKPIALAGLDGNLIASSLSQFDEAIINSLSEEIGQKGRDMLKNLKDSDAVATATIVSKEGRKIVIELLRAELGRPVGWLLYFKDDSQPQ